MRINFNKLVRSGFSVDEVSPGEWEIHMGGHNPEFWNKITDHLQNLDLTIRQAEKLRDELYPVIEDHMIVLGIKGELP